MIKVIHGEIWSPKFEKLDNLVKDFQSCVRFCYNRFCKDKLKFNDVRKIAKVQYGSLNTRQISDAVVQGQALQKRIKNKKIIFGGRKNWNDFVLGKITKKQWIEKRDKQIYLRGDKARSGNLNARIVDGKLRVTIGIRKWVFYKLFIPKKFNDQLLCLLKIGTAYNVRLIRKNENVFRVIVDYKENDPKIVITLKNGCIGVDVNLDRIAIANVSKDGNLIKTKTFINNRILYGSRNKRNHDIGCLIGDIIDYSKETNKGIVFENLKFKQQFKKYDKQWNRKKSNFIWKRFIQLLESKCIENGIEYKKVNPSFTSVIGKYKYKPRYKITIHESAAYTIGRRGIGLNEKLSLYGFPKLELKSNIIRTLAGKYNGIRYNSWILWKTLDDKIKATLTASQLNPHNLKELCANLCGDGEKPSGESS